VAGVQMGEAIVNGMGGDGAALGTPETADHARHQYRGINHLSPLVSPPGSARAAGASFETADPAAPAPAAPR
jgi:hypothetical protein